MHSPDKSKHCSRYSKALLQMHQSIAFRLKKHYSAILRLYQLLCNMFKSGKRTHFDLFIRSIPRIFAPILYGRAKEGAAQSSKSFAQSNG